MNEKKINDLIKSYQKRLRESNKTTISTKNKEELIDSTLTLYQIINSYESNPEIKI